MAKKRRSSKKSSRTVNRRSYSSSVDGHPLFTALFIIFCVIIAGIALFTVTLHKMGEELDEHITTQIQSTPIVTQPAMQNKKY